MHKLLYVSLNKVIEKNNEPIFIIKKYLLLFYKVKQLTVLDLASAYWQIFLTKKSQKYTAFLIAFRFYQFRIILFDLVNALIIFQKLMNNILWDYLKKFYLVYLNNIIIYLKSLKNYK